MISKDEFLSVVDYCIENRVKYLAVAVEGVGTEEELIINPNSNFEEKRSYYDEKYDDEMRLKVAPHIRITYVAGWTHLAYFEEGGRR